jgi:hypothetical protein
VRAKARRVMRPSQARFGLGRPSRGRVLPVSRMCSGGGGGGGGGAPRTADCLSLTHAARTCTHQGTLMPTATVPAVPTRTCLPSADNTLNAKPPPAALCVGAFASVRCAVVC